ncbi:MAG: amidase family protein, partial [Patescibacteria group bacterium]
EVFKKADALITPTSPFTAFAIGEKSSDTLAMYLADVMEIPASLSGMPAITVPAGLSKNNLPIGVQVIGPRLAEGRVMQIGQLITI